jgi:hypothetical protein
VSSPFSRRPRHRRQIRCPPDDFERRLHRHREDFVGKKPRTRVALTRAGRKAFTRHVAYLRDILDGVVPGESK